MNFTRARQSVTQLSHLPEVRRVGDIAGAKEAGVRIRAYHIGERREEPKRVLLQMVPSERNKEELIAQAKPCAGLGPISVADMSVVDPIGDGNHAIWRVSRIRSQILPSNQFAYSDKTRYVVTPPLLSRPGVLIEERRSDAVQGLDDRDASCRGRSHKPIRRTMNADDVRPVFREPLLDVVLGELDEWHAVEVKRVATLSQEGSVGVCATTVSKPCDGSRRARNSATISSPPSFSVPVATIQRSRVRTSGRRDSRNHRTGVGNGVLTAQRARSMPGECTPTFPRVSELTGRGHSSVLSGII